MAELRIPRAHSNDWYDQLATQQDGYYLPWQSHIGRNDGETAFHDLVLSEMKPDMVVLEVGCGHGDLAIKLAPHCKRLIAYDRVPRFIQTAKEAQSASGPTNIEFLQYDALDYSGDAVTLPVEDQSVDMIVCRRGPLHWIGDASRVCKPGARLIQISPMEEPIPAWSSKLPHVMHYENSGRHTGSGSIHQSIENRLHQAGLVLHSGWGFDVPDVFNDPMELYKMIVWGLPVERIPPYPDVEQKIQMIFDTYADDQGVTLRHCRYLWYARM